MHNMSPGLPIARNNYLLLGSIHLEMLRLLYFYDYFAALSAKILLVF